MENTLTHGLKLQENWAMVNKNNVKSEFDLYTPMCNWLNQYIKDNYKNFDVITVDAHAERLDKVLAKHGVVCELAVGVDIQIDILGIARKKEVTKLFFIEAKKTNLTLRDLGQLWSYCKLIDPEEAFLMTSAKLGSLNKILNTFKREDLLDFGDGKRIKKMKVAIWNLSTNTPEVTSMLPKL